MPTSKKLVILFGAHRWGKSYIITKVLNGGYDVLLVKYKKEQLEIDKHLLKSKRISKFDILETDDITQIQKLIDSIKNKYTSYWTIGLDDYTNELSSIFSKLLKLQTFPEKSVEICNNKHLLRDLWNNFSANNPDLRKINFQLINDIDHFDAVNNLYIEYPLILKPNSLDASIGVRRINNPNDFKKYVTYIKKEFRYVLIQNKKNHITIPAGILAEENIVRNNAKGQSSEFTAHFITINKSHFLIGIAEKIIDNFTFIELGHTFPSQNFNDRYLGVVNEIFTKMLNYLQVANGISNWEFISTADNKIAMVEGQLRPSGDHVMDIIELSTGMNPISCLLKNKLDNLSFTITPNKVSSIFWLFIKIPLFKIIDITNENDFDETIYVELSKDELISYRYWQGPKNWFSRKSFILSYADTYMDLILKLKSYLNKIVIKGINKDQIGNEHIVYTCFSLPDDVNNLAF